jgi:hypothetical protein
MLLNGGELDGVRILNRKADDSTAWLGTPGTNGWSGGYNTCFRIDADQKVVFALFVRLDFTSLRLELQHGFHDAAVQAQLPAAPR